MRTQIEVADDDLVSVRITSAQFLDRLTYVQTDKGTPLFETLPEYREMNVQLPDLEPTVRVIQPQGEDSSARVLSIVKLPSCCVERSDNLRRATLDLKTRSKVARGEIRRASGA